MTSEQQVRALDKTLYERLLTGQWLREKQNVLFTGKINVGETWLVAGRHGPLGPRLADLPPRFGKYSYDSDRQYVNSRRSPRTAIRMGRWN